MHSDNLLLPIVLLLVTPIFATRKLIPADSLFPSTFRRYGSLAGPSDPEKHKGRISFDDLNFSPREEIVCNEYLSHDPRLWPLDYTPTVFEESVFALCAFNGHPEHNLHLRCTHDPAARLQVTPDRPSYVEFINDMPLLAYCLSNCKCKTEGDAPVSHPKKWFHIAPGWLANTESYGLQVATKTISSDEDDIQVQTLIAPLPQNVLNPMPAEVTAHPVASDFDSEEPLDDTAQLIADLNILRDYTPGYAIPNTPEQTAEPPKQQPAQETPEEEERKEEQEEDVPETPDETIARIRRNLFPPRLGAWQPENPDETIGSPVESRGSPLQEPGPDVCPVEYESDSEGMGSIGNSQVLSDGPVPEIVPEIVPDIEDIATPERRPQPPRDLTPVTNECTLDDYDLTEDIDDTATQFHDVMYGQRSVSAHTNFESAHGESLGCSYNFSENRAPLRPADPEAGPSRPYRTNPGTIGDWVADDWAECQLRQKAHLAGLIDELYPNSPQRGQSSPREGRTLFDGSQILNSTAYYDDPNVPANEFNYEYPRTPGRTESSVSSLEFGNAEEEPEPQRPYNDDEITFAPIENRPDFGVMYVDEEPVGVWSVSRGITDMAFMDSATMIDLLTANAAARQTATSTSTTTIRNTKTRTSATKQSPLGAQTLAKGPNRQGYITDKDNRWGAWHVRDGITSYRPWKYPVKKPSRRNAALNAQQPDPRVGATNAQQTSAFRAAASIEAKALARERAACASRGKRAKRECAWWAPYETPVVQMPPAMPGNIASAAGALETGSPSRKPGVMLVDQCGDRCSSFDSKVCGAGCKCIARPTLKDPGASWLFLGVCASTVLLKGFSGGVLPGGGVRKPATGVLGKRAAMEMTKREVELLGVVCPCNATYVSKGCCQEGVGGMVWEGFGEKLGQLDL